MIAKTVTQLSKKIVWVANTHSEKRAHKDWSLLKWDQSLPSKKSFSQYVSLTQKISVLTSKCLQTSSSSPAFTQFPSPSSSARKGGRGGGGRRNSGGGGLFSPGSAAAIANDRWGYDQAWPDVVMPGIEGGKYWFYLYALTWYDCIKREVIQIVCKRQHYNIGKTKDFPRKKRFGQKNLVFPLSLLYIPFLLSKSDIYAQKLPPLFRGVIISFFFFFSSDKICGKPAYVCKEKKREKFLELKIVPLCASSEIWQKERGSSKKKGKKRTL